LIAGASFCSTTRSYDPPIGQWSKSADTRRTPSTSWCAQCDVSHWGDTPGEEARRQEQTTERLRSSESAPLPARNQAEIFSVCFQQEPHVNKVLLLFVAHAYCAFAVSRSMLPHTIAHHTPLHTVHHFTPHTIAHHTPLHPAHHCTLHPIVPYTPVHPAAHIRPILKNCVFFYPLINALCS
jgi:hypothetical protein